MVEAAPQGKAFPTGENDETRKCFGVCEIYGAHHRRGGVNKTWLIRWQEKIWLPVVDSNRKQTAS